jgi:hypothetical protein
LRTDSARCSVSPIILFEHFDVSPNFESIIPFDFSLSLLGTETFFFVDDVEDGPEEGLPSSFDMLRIRNQFSDVDSSHEPNSIFELIQGDPTETRCSSESIRFFFGRSQFVFFGFFCLFIFQNGAFDLLFFAFFCFNFINIGDENQASSTNPKSDFAVFRNFEPIVERHFHVVLSDELWRRFRNAERSIFSSFDLLQLPLAARVRPHSEDCFVAF